MAELVVLDFDGTETADVVLAKLRELRKEHLIDLLDAVVVIHPEGGDIQIKQSVNLTALGASQGMTTGALLGALAGLLVLNPLAGFALGGAAGAAMGALGGRMADFGINDGFIKELGQTIKPGTSALFVLVAKATTDKVVAEIREHKPRVLRTSLSSEQEGALRAALAGEAPGPAPAA
jgi:uncharacterized membrane protein